MSMSFDPVYLLHSRDNLDMLATPAWISFISLFQATDRLRQIFRASPLGISVWRGTVSTAPVAGLHHKECPRPSRLR